MIDAAFIVFNVLGIFFVLLPSGWHWEVKNTGTLLLIFWCLATVVPTAINAIVWYSNVDPIVPVWCDVSSCRLEKALCTY
jgi:hypothetical protein